MRRGAFSVFAALAFTLASAGCATTRSDERGARSPGAPELETGELESATPTVFAAGRASTQSSASMALGGRRERVRDTVDAYLHAVLESDVDGAMALFADPVMSAETNQRARSVEELTSHHRAAVGYDMSYLRLELEQESGAPVVRSTVEFRRGSPSGYAGVQPGDWVVDLPFVNRAPYTSAARYLPTRMVIRFVGSLAKIVAISSMTPLRM